MSLGGGVIEHGFQVHGYLDPRCGRREEDDTGSIWQSGCYTKKGRQDGLEEGRGCMIAVGQAGREMKKERRRIAQTD